MTALLTAYNPVYFKKILNWKEISHTPVGGLFKINGFDQYNFLVDINSVFSRFPYGDIIDRTQTVLSPFKYLVQRPWQPPAPGLTLDQVMQHRTQWYVDLAQPLDLCWSGGLDSTSLIVAFLKHAPHLDQLRVLYSPHSVYENRDFFEFLQKNYPQIELLDMSGDVYLSSNFDQHLVTGHGGDEFTASLDDSFYEKTGKAVLESSWQDYFYQQTHNQELIDFAEQYFALSGLNITTLMQARWWFYSATKTQCHATANDSFVLNQSNADQRLVTGFFDCDDFESYIHYNTDVIINYDSGYRGYKQFLREYIYQFDKNEARYNKSGKVNSAQFALYINKKTIMTDSRWILKLSDNSVVRTKNLPFFSKKEFDQAYGSSLDYIFNQPSTI
jgi:hypothetical protein